MQPETEQKPTSGITRLAKFLKAVNRFDAYPTFIEHGITDIWFPFPRQTLRQLLKDPRSVKEFSHLQETELGSTSTERLLRWVKQSQHKIFADGKEVIKSDKILSEGVTASSNKSPRQRSRSRWYAYEKKS